MRNTGFQCRKYFNSRPSARGDPIPAHGDSTFPFQFTPLREGRRVTRSPTPQAANFNSRPSARGDLMPFRHFPCLSISIHAPPRGATAHRPAAQAELHYFNSRPSARGDLKCLITGCAHLAISIHAPPRGATARQNVGDCIRVFQFTPLREGRLSQKSITPVGDYFNSRPSARGDSGQRPPSLLNPHFNSRPSARGDAIKGGSAIMYKFQFTPLREGRLPARFSLRASCTYFNSRPSARGDFSR